MRNGFNSIPNTTPRSDFDTIPGSRKLGDDPMVMGAQTIVNLEGFRIAGEKIEKIVEVGKFITKGILANLRYRR
jgi:hypothetical protein